MARVALIGLGRMGSGMASRLLEAGHTLVVANRTPERAAPLAWNAPLAPTQAAALQSACREGTRLYLQIYDEAMRPRAELLRQRLLEAGLPLKTPIENVTRSATLRQQRPPVPWQQPTLVVHDPQVRDCAQALAQALQQRWSPPAGGQVLVTPLPARLKGQPNTLELWLPTPPPGGMGGGQAPDNQKQ